MKKLNKIAAVLLALTLALALTACGAAKIDSVELPTELTVEKGETLDIELLVNAGDADKSKVDEAISKLGGIVWETSDDTVVAINENGKPVAVGQGEASLTGRLGDMTAVCKVTVLVTATGIEVPEKMELAVGDEPKNLDAKVLPEGAELKLTYVSSDETVATVDENGNVTAVGVGECVVTTTSEDSAVKDETQTEVEESNSVAGDKSEATSDDAATDTSTPAEKEKNETPALKGETNVVVKEAGTESADDESAVTDEKAPENTDKDTGKTSDKNSNTSGKTNKDNKDTSSKGDNNSNNKNDNGSNSAANKPTNGNGGNSTANQNNKPAPEVKPEQPVTPPASQPTTPPAPPAPAPNPVPAPPLQPDENGVVHGNDGGVGHIDLEDGHWGTDTGATRS